MCVWGHHPFQPVVHKMPYQDWILSDGVFDNISGSFRCEALNTNNSASVQAQVQFESMMSAGVSSGEHTLPTLNTDIIAEILVAMCAMPSWKACEMEGTSWNGTVEENIQKYVSSNS
jgi:hypothetical protein